MEAGGEKILTTQQSAGTITLKIRRYLPEEGVRRYQEFRLPFQRGRVILDYLNHLKDKVDPTLAFRWSCRMGMCGSCGAMVNGTPRLTCQTYPRDIKSDVIIVEPLESFPVVRDLVVDIRDFVAKLKRISPWLIRREEKPLEEGEYLQTPQQQAEYLQSSLCINCALCYSACPVYQEDRKFVGPAALALAFRYNNDSRDQGIMVRSKALSGTHGLDECSDVGGCTVACPKGVDPFATIKKSRLQLNELKSRSLPDG